MKSSTAARVGAFVVVVILLGATIVILVLGLRDNAELRRQVSALDKRINLLTSTTESRIDGLSRDVKDLSRGMRKELASTRRSAAGDVSRMGRGLSGRLDAMTRQMKDLAASPRQEPPQPAVEESPPVAASAPAVPPEPAPIDQDLSFLHRMKSGTALFESGKYQQSREVFRSALAQRPSDPAARLYFALSMFRANPGDATSYPQVERNLRSVLSSDAGNQLALETLAMVEMEQKKWPAALENLARLLTVQPDDPRLLKMAGDCALMEGDAQRARNWFDHATIQAPADAEAWSSLGDSESRLGNQMQAEKAWKTSLSSLDLATPVGKRAGLELSIKLARSAHDRGAHEDALSYVKDGERLGDSPLLRAYEGLSLTATDHEQEGTAILESVAASSDTQAAALAREGLQAGAQ